MILSILFFFPGCERAVQPPVLAAAWLEGVPAYYPGDDPGWALSSPKVPEGKPRRPDRKLMGWHILTFFQQGPVAHAVPALLLKGAGCAHEVFVNGQKIGAKGELGYFFMDAPFDGGLYPIPKGLIRADRENRIALRTFNGRNDFSVPEPAFYLGNRRDLLPVFREQAAVSKLFEITLAGLLTVFLFSALTLYAAGMRGPEYRSFIVLVLSYLVVVLIDSRMFYDAGLKNWMVQRLFLCLVMLIPAAFFQFIFTLNGDAGSLKDRILSCFFIVAAWAMAIARIQDHYYLAPFCFLVVIGGLATALYRPVRAWRKKRYESVTVLVGTGGILVTLALEAAGLFQGLGIHFFLVFDLGFVFFLASVGFGLLHRYVRTHHHNLLLSEKIIKAHQEERMRFSRDIHDGLGQSLAALKLSMQLTAAGKKGEPSAGELNRFIPEVTRISGEVREMARALRPAYVEELDVTGLLTRLAGRTEDRTGLMVNTHLACEGLDLPADIKDNLFRLCQEAMNNITRHSGAHRADIHAAVTGKTLGISISDDGRGFDPDTAQQGLGLVGRTGDGNEAVRLAGELSPDLVILDNSMPGISGMAAAAEILKRTPSARVIILTMYGDAAIASQALRKGVSGFLIKDSAFDELAKAIGCVMEGETFLSPELALKMLNQGITGNGASLTSREVEVLRLIALGHSNKKTAGLLHISPKTVDTHRTRIMKKLDLHSTAQLVRFAVRMGLIQP